MERSSLVQFAQDLVQRPSLSCQEGEVARRAEEEMKALGYDEVRTDPFGSVVGVLNGKGGGKTLLFDAHTDTVDVKGAVPWRKDPFSGDVEGEFLYGRGSADMKGALAAMIHGVASIDRERIEGRIVVCASPMEEVLEGVALREVMGEYPPDCVVIGEATDLGLARGGRGRAEIHLEAAGVPTHSSAPHLGRNAVLEMIKLVSQLEDAPLPEDPVMGPAILALTEIASAPYPANSVIPSICRATYDRRTIPGETVDVVLEPMRSIAATHGIDLKAAVGIGEYTTFTGKKLRKEKFFPAWLFDEDHWFVEKALAGLSGRGLKPKTSAYRFCTNAAYSAGEAGIPTVGFGPAKETDAHMVDERLRLDDLEAAAEGYAGIAEAVLGS